MTSVQTCRPNDAGTNDAGAERRGGASRRGGACVRLPRADAGTNEDADAEEAADTGPAAEATEPTTVADEAAPAPTVPTAVTQPDRMNVRAGPGTNYGIVTSVPAGTAMEILALGPAVRMVSGEAGRPGRARVGLRRAGGRTGSNGRPRANCGGGPSGPAGTGGGCSSLSRPVRPAQPSPLPRRLRAQASSAMASRPTCWAGKPAPL